MFEIKLYRATHHRKQGQPPHTWEAKVLSEEQESVWGQHGFLAHMLYPTEGLSLEKLYEEVFKYEEAFNPKNPETNPEPADEIPHLDPKHFLQGVGEMVRVGLIHVEVVAERVVVKRPSKAA